MDIVSHAFWGGVVLGRHSRRAFLVAASVSVLPDLLSEGFFGGIFVLGIGGMPTWDQGHPNITAYPLWAQQLYGGTHSLVSFALVFLLVSVLTGRLVWSLCAWALHILIDIPTHSLQLFPTPFLWPLSEFKVDGIRWSHPAILGSNVFLLLLTYSLWWRTSRHASECQFERRINDGPPNQAL